MCRGHFHSNSIRFLRQERETEVVAVGLLLISRSQEVNLTGQEVSLLNPPPLPHTPPPKVANFHPQCVISAMCLTLCLGKSCPPSSPPRPRRKVLLLNAHCGFYRPKESKASEPHVLSLSPSLSQCNVCLLSPCTCTRRRGLDGRSRLSANVKKGGG